MSWKRHFSPVNSKSAGSSTAPLFGTSTSAPGPAARNYSTYLPDVYTGSPNRIERYMQYDSMDIDSEVNAALDILAEFCTQRNKENQTPFTLFFKGQPTGSEVRILKEYLQQWSKLQQLDTRIFRIARNLFKYGDGFFVRDPETYKWVYIDPGKVVKIIVNESAGKVPEQYVIRDLNVNLMNLVTTQINPNSQNTQPGGAAYVQGGAGARGMTGAYPQQTGTRFSLAQNEFAVDAKHVVHLSLSEGLDNNYPFGSSLLESVFKVYKQKELLEDAIIIYRVQRAPERRVFYIDVGNMPSHLAMGFVERVKNEIHQRRIPSSTGGTSSVIDSSYNPLCLDLTTKIPLLDGRTLTLSELIAEFESGKENWAYSCNPETGEIVPGVINWAGVTRKDAEVIKLTFDNGKELICTPDHKIPVFGKGFVEAKDLTPADSLIAFNTQDQSVWDHSLQQWKPVDEVVGQFFKAKNKHQEFTYLKENAGEEKTVIRHSDGNYCNNDPRNLVFMSSKDYALYKAVQTDDFWVAFGSVVSNELSDQWKNWSAEERLSVVWNIGNGIKDLFKSDYEKVTADYEAQGGTASITKIEKITNRDVGTITIDGTERWHNFHTFAIDSGVFVKNSVNEDFFFPQTSEGRGSKVETLPGGCLAMDTLVPLLDGRTLTITELADEYQAGIQNWVYSCDPATGNFVPGVVSWAGVTQQAATVMRLKFDNGKELICTPDHKFPIIRKGLVKAADLVIGESMIPHNVQGNNVYQNGDSTWESICNVVEAWKVKNSVEDCVVVDQDGDIVTDPINCSLVEIEYLSDTMTVGTLTIDQEERYHNYHNFALAIGIYTQNSNLGEINDLQFFTNKLMRALRIPSSYLPTGADDSQSQYNDGRVGTAYIQELRFNKYCERLQALMLPAFDREFKQYLYNRGVNIDFSLFDLRFQSPQNFASYRQAELDNQRIGTFTQMASLPFVSARFALKRFLGLTDEDIAENERLWKEEHGEGAVQQDAAGELRASGISPTGISADLDAASDTEVAEEPPADAATQGAPQATAQQATTQPPV